MTSSRIVAIENVYAMGLSYFCLSAPALYTRIASTRSKRIGQRPSHHICNPGRPAHSSNRQPSNSAKIPVERELPLRHVIQAAEVHVVHSSGKRSTHHIQVPIILRTIHYHIAATHKLRQLFGFPHIPQKQPAPARARTS